jgi:hypothetical protein
MIFQEPLNDVTQLDDYPPSSAGQRDARAYSKISNKIIKQQKYEEGGWVLHNKDPSGDSGGWCIILLDESNGKG